MNGLFFIWVFQGTYNTPLYRTPQPIPLENYERNPGLKRLLVKVARIFVPVRCVETTLEGFHVGKLYVLVPWSLCMEPMSFL